MKTSERPAWADSADQERLAGRLLRSTAARSYDPELDIDWSALPVTMETPSRPRRTAR